MYEPEKLAQYGTFKAHQCCIYQKPLIVRMFCAALQGDSCLLLVFMLLKPGYSLLISASNPQ